MLYTVKPLNTWEFVTAAAAEHNCTDVLAILCLSSHVYVCVYIFFSLPMSFLFLLHAFLLDNPNFAFSIELN